MCFGDSPLHHGTLVTVAMPAVMRFFNGKLENGVLERFAEAMNLVADKDAGNRIADAVTDINAKLGLPSTVREMGYEKTDVSRMIQEAHDSPFNLPSPIRPCMADYEQLVAEVLG
jgi:hypothetical protein